MVHDPTRKISLALSLLLLLTTSGLSEPFLQPNTTFRIGELQILMRNWDLAKSKKILFVHFEVRNFSKIPQRCSWRELVWLIGPEGEVVSSNYDALVDSGTGFSRATGPVEIPKGGKRIKISVPFVLGPNDLPARIQISDGHLSPVVR